MIVDGKQVPPAVEHGLEEWMLTHRFTAGGATAKAEEMLKASGTDFALGHRLADRLIQRLRKAKRIEFKRVRCRGTVWSAVA